MARQEKLPIVDLKEGSGPPCQFLDLPLPDEPLPGANDFTAAAQAAGEISTNCWIWIGIIPLLALLL